MTSTTLNNAAKVENYNLIADKFLERMRKPLHDKAGITEEIRFIEQLLKDGLLYEFGAVQLLKCLYMLRDDY